MRVHSVKIFIKIGPLDFPYIPGQTQKLRNQPGTAFTWSQWRRAVNSPRQITRQCITYCIFHFYRSVYQYIHRRSVSLILYILHCCRDTRSLAAQHMAHKAGLWGLQEQGQVVIFTVTSLTENLRDGDMITQIWSTACVGVQDRK